MVGLYMMSQLHKLLTIARHEDGSAPFGKMNMIFAGDFLQFSPVRDMALYSDILPMTYDTRDVITCNRPKLTLSERQIQCRVGKALWNQINTVVALSKQMRIQDADFLQIQNRIRTGEGTEQDYVKLRARIISPVNDLKSLRDYDWRTAPMLVCRNELRTKLNIMAVTCFSQEMHIKPIVCVAKDTMHGLPIKSGNIIRFILSLSDNKTEGLPGYLPLVPGLSEQLLIKSNIAINCRDESDVNREYCNRARLSQWHDWYFSSFDLRRRGD